MADSVRIVELLKDMETYNASDLFITAQKSPYYRVYGEIKNLDVDPLTKTDFTGFINDNLPPGILDRLMDKRDMDIGLSLSDSERYRLNLFYQKGNISMVARKVPLGNLEFENLRLPEILKKFSEAPRGLVLITGATGSGKSSTMAAQLHHINSKLSKHIVTVEDPIEFIHNDMKSVVSQREVGNDTESFAASLKYIVRQSPDVIFIGEMRDMDTIRTAISAAMTGHLVITTMHTVDPAQTLERILNYFPEEMREQLALDFSISLLGIVSQRLLRKKDNEGLVPAFEILVATPLIRKLIANRQIDEVADQIKAGAGDGMTTFTKSLVNLVRNDEVELETASAVATNKEEFMLAIQGMQTGIDTLRQDDGDDHSKMNMRNLLRAAIKHNASDLIISVGCAPTLRIDGELNELNLDTLSPQDTQRLLFSVLSPSQRAQFESQREIDFALSINATNMNLGTELTGFRFRVNGFYQKSSVSGAFRLIPQHIPPPDKLGIPNIVMKQSYRHHGLVLVTGPTGHGKSTTLACLINEINNKRSCHIISVEDPIEYVHENKKAIVEQREVYADTKSFATALKYVLRQDPDVILIGEMRDMETISAGLTAAETGHLVFATLHTNDCPQTIDRIIDSFPPHQQNQVRSQLANCINAIISQRLLPKANGEGRVACFEVMIGTIAIKTLIRDNRVHQILATIETSAKDGMITMDKSLETLYNQNQITRQTMQQLLRHAD